MDLIHTSQLLGFGDGVVFILLFDGHSDTTTASPVIDLSFIRSFSFLFFHPIDCPPNWLSFLDCMSFAFVFSSDFLRAFSQISFLLLVVVD